jgi:hypothetical protein
VNDLVIALIVFACVFGSALLGLYLHARLPEHHLSDESIGVVKLATGLIATIADARTLKRQSGASSNLDGVRGCAVRKLDQ